MAKWYGKVGYAEQVEVQPGVWSQVITERSYFGDSMRNSRTLQGSNQVIDNISVNSQISIVADPYAYHNFHTMIYVEFMENLWKVATVDVQSPRLVLTLGGIYTGPVYESSAN